MEASSPSHDVLSKAHGTPTLRRRFGAAAARLRLASGLVLFSFVATHLLNHALGLVSLAAMETGRIWMMAPWRSAPGKGLLVLAALVHLGQACWSIYRRRHLRMPLWQAVQLVLGFMIPLVLVHHVVGTALASERFGYDPDYTVVVLVQWVLQPHLGLGQALLVCVAWAHGCMGVHYWLRGRAWYPRVGLLLYTVAVLVPVLALLGFAQVGRYVSLLALDPQWVQDILSDARSPSPAALAMLMQTRDTVLLVLAALLLLTFAARIVRQLVEARRSVRITYPGNQVVTVPKGFSVLESSRQAGIVHTAICGGRGRCSTCRVRVVAGAQALPPPGAEEERVLARVQAPPNVRLACQLRPLHDVAVLPLIPPSQEGALASADPGFMAGREREICVLFADLRGFTRLSEQRLPYDVVFLLNRYFEAAGGAIDAAGGIANQFTGDGVMALFGVRTTAQEGARQAVRAALALQDAMLRLSADLHEELPEPLQLGIGIHCGPTVVGHMGRGVATYLTAVGDTVNTASRLQDQTKHFGCQLVISDHAAQRAGLDTSALRHEQIQVRNRDSSISVHVVEDLQSLRWRADARPITGAIAGA
jgi:adenylate cyclase